MFLRLDPTAALPLYHQIAQAIRYRIAVGVLSPGEELPPLREAAAGWGVNLHTVRRAYRELAEKGLVETRVPFGTRVVRRNRTAPRRERTVGEFVSRIIEEAREVHGLSIDELSRLLHERGDGGRKDRPTVYLVECSQPQCEDLARQLENQFIVQAHPWRLDRPEPPAEGIVVSTFFHYNDLRRQWPKRLPEVHFVAIQPDPTIGSRLDGSAGSNRPINVLLCEREETMADNIEADLSRALPRDRFRITSRITDQPGSVLGEAGECLVLFSPRVWGDLTNKQRAHRRARELRYVFEPKSLAALADELGWQSI